MILYITCHLLLTWLPLLKACRVPVLHCLLLKIELAEACTKDIHYPELDHTGFVCGGKQPPQAIAIAMAVCYLQARVLAQEQLREVAQQLVSMFTFPEVKKQLHQRVVFLDQNYSPVATLVDGTIQPPP